MDVNELPYRTLYLHAWLLLNSGKDNLIPAYPMRIREYAFGKRSIKVATFEVVDMLDSLLKAGLIEQCKVDGEPFIKVIPIETSVHSTTGSADKASKGVFLKDNPDILFLRTSLADVMGRAEDILIRAVRECNAVLALPYPDAWADLHQRVRLFYGAALLQLSTTVFKSQHFRLHLHKDGIREPELLDNLIKIFSGDFLVDGVCNPVDERDGCRGVCSDGGKCGNEFGCHGSSCAGKVCECKQPHPTTQGGTAKEEGE